MSATVFCTILDWIFARTLGGAHCPLYEPCRSFRSVEFKVRIIYQASLIQLFFLLLRYLYPDKWMYVSYLVHWFCFLLVFAPRRSSERFIVVAFIVSYILYQFILFFFASPLDSYKNHIKKCFLKSYKIVQNHNVKQLFVLKFVKLKLFKVILSTEN